MFFTFVYILLDRDCTCVVSSRPNGQSRAPAITNVFFAEVITMLLRALPAAQCGVRGHSGASHERRISPAGISACNLLLSRIAHLTRKSFLESVFLLAGSVFAGVVLVSCANGPSTPPESLRSNPGGPYSGNVGQ